MAHAHGGAPVFVKIAAARAFDIGPHVGRIREVEVGSEAVFDPRILAVDVIDLAVAAYNGVVAQKLMHCGDAQISRAPVFRTAHAEGKARTSHQTVGVIEAIGRAVGERENVCIHMRVGEFNLRFKIEGLRKVEAPAELSGERGDDVVHRTENLNQVQGRLTIVEGRLEGNSRALKAFLEQLKTSLEEQGIMVDIDTVRGVLRVPESAVTFGVGLNTLDDSNLEKVKIIGNVLEKELPCYQPLSMKEPHCLEMNPNGNTLDAVFIEGHTDNQTYRGDLTGRRNRLLSTSRSSAVFDAMVVGRPGLEGLTNIRNERLFSLSGYGASRPLPGHEHPTPTNDPANRRIEFRFIMTPPAISKEESRLIRSDAETVHGS